VKLVSVRQIALDLDVDARIVRGVAIGLGISPERTTAADYFTQEEAARIKDVLRLNPKPPAVKRRRKAGVK
jgi:hypothetical protein